jgi:hypothetical protein
METLPPLPPFNFYGHLPEGVHDTTLEELQERLAFNPRRVVLWGRLTEFMKWVMETQTFSFLYLDGGFITNKASPEDIDVILQTRAGYGMEAFAAMEPFSPWAWTRYTTSIRSISISGARDFRAA